jgi:hypothetical protein
MMDEIQLSFSCVFSAAMPGWLAWLTALFSTRISVTPPCFQLTKPVEKHQVLLFSF